MTEEKDQLGKHPNRAPPNSEQCPSQASRSKIIDTGGGGRQNAHLAVYHDKFTEKYSDAEEHHKRYASNNANKQKIFYLNIILPI